MVNPVSLSPVGRDLAVLLHTEGLLAWPYLSLVLNFSSENTQLELSFSFLALAGLVSGSGL